MTTILAGVMISAFSIPAFAGSWQSDSTGWWWQNDDGSYPANSWQQLDGNSDGTAECYYFDGTGVWIVNGVVQTQKADTQTGQTTENEAQNSVYTDDYSGTYAVPYFEMDGSKTYHDVIITYDAGSNSIFYNDPIAGYTATYTYFGAGLNGWTSFELVSTEEKSSIFFSALV